MVEDGPLSGEPFENGQVGIPSNSPFEPGVLRLNFDQAVFEMFDGWAGHRVTKFNDGISDQVSFVRVQLDSDSRCLVFALDTKGGQFLLQDV